MSKFSKIKEIYLLVKTNAFLRFALKSINCILRIAHRILLLIIVVSLKVQERGLELLKRVPVAATELIIS